MNWKELRAKGGVMFNPEFKSKVIIDKKCYGRIEGNDWYLTIDFTDYLPGSGNYRNDNRETNGWIQALLVRKTKEGIAYLRIYTGHKLKIDDFVSDEANVEREKLVDRYNTVLLKYGLCEYMSGSHNEIGYKLRALFRAIEEFEGKDTLKEWKEELGHHFPIQPRSLVTQAFFKARDTLKDRDNIRPDILEVYNGIQDKKALERKHENFRLEVDNIRNKIIVVYEGMDIFFHRISISTIDYDEAAINFNANSFFLIQNKISLHSLILESGFPIDAQDTDILQIIERPLASNNESNTFAIVGTTNECLHTLLKLITIIEKMGGEDALVPAHKNALLTFFKPVAAVANATPLNLPDIKEDTSVRKIM